MTRVVLLAGASGSGKSRVARLAGCPQLTLDDFYRDVDEPGLPRTTSNSLDIVDWDDVASWDAAAAFAAVAELCRKGAADVPSYDIARSRRTGTRLVDAGRAECFVAEGLFAPELVQSCQAAELNFDALYLDRPRTLSLILRFVRDVREQRKPFGVLVRRGIALFRAEPALRAYAVSHGCRPVTLRKALEIIAGDDKLGR